MKKKLSRSEARCEAFKIIFSLSQHKDDVDFLFENLAAEEPASVTSMPYIKSTVLGVMEKEDELLEIIANNLKSGWRIDRISKMAKSILMLAIYEILYSEDVPAPVAINEAVELAKKFDEPESASFINGVLAGVVK